MKRISESPVEWIKSNHPLTGCVAEAFWRNPAAWLGEHGQALKTSGYQRETLAVTVDDSGQQLIVKYFSLRGFAARLKWKLKQTAPQKEWELLTYLHEQGIAVPCPLALGVQHNGSVVNVWLVLEYITGAVTFDQIRPVASLADMTAAARGLADCIAKLHCAGVWHGDLHSGNLLFQPDTGKWIMADFQHARRGNPRRTELVNDLVQLQHCLGKKVPLGVRIVFLREYIKSFARLTSTEDEMAGDEWRLLFGEIRAKSTRYAIAQARKRRNRSLTGNREFAPLRDWLGSDAVPPQFENGWVVRSVSRQLMQDVIELISDETWYLNPQIRLIKNTGSAAVGVLTHPQGTVFIKQFRYKPRLADRFRLLRHSSKSHTAWRASWQLRHLHLPVPQPLLVAWTPTGGFLVQECIPDIMSCDNALRSLSAQAFPQQRRKLIHAMAREVSRMHDRAVAHNDLKGSNLIVSRVTAPDMRVYFIDVHPASFHSYLPWSARVKDLARLYAALYPFCSAAERRYFLRIYLKYQTEPVDIRQLIMDVRERAEEKILQKHGIRLSS